MTTDGYSFEAHIKELQQRLATAEAERDRLTDRIKELEDALAEEIALADSREAEIKRLTQIGEERHVSAKDTEEGLMDHVERLQVEKERLRKIITEEINLLHDEGEHVWADCLEDDLYKLEVDGGKETY